MTLVSDVGLPLDTLNTRVDRKLGPYLAVSSHLAQEAQSLLQTIY